MDTMVEYQITQLDNDELHSYDKYIGMQVILNNVANNGENFTFIK